MIEYQVSLDSEAKFQKLRKVYFVQPNFTYEKVFSQSAAAGTIYNWMIAIDKYQKIWTEVSPKEAQLR